MVSTVTSTVYHFSPASITIHVMNEFRFRMKRSILWWCYIGCIAVLIIPAVLVNIYYRNFNITISWQNLLVPLLFFQLFFYILNLDVFNREKELNMVDQISMHSVAFNKIYLARLITSAVLMIIPACTSQFILFFSQPLSPGIPDHLFDMFIILIYYIFWYLIATVTFTLIELRFRDFNRVVIYIIMISVIISSLFLLSRSITELSSIIGIFTGENLAENLVVSAVFLLSGSIIALYFIIRCLNNIINEDQATASSEDIEADRNENVIRHIFTYLLSRTNELRIIKLGKWQIFIVLLVYLLPIVAISNPDQLSLILALVFGVHLFLVHVHVLMVVFPRITLEKEYNMEELLLSKIASSEYLTDKIKILLRSLLVPMALPVAILALTSPYLIPLVPFLLIRTIFFISILLLIWRVLPAKNLLHSAVLSVLGLDIFLYAFIAFMTSGIDLQGGCDLYSNCLTVFLAPVVSNLFLYEFLGGSYIPCMSYVIGMVFLTLFLSYLFLFTTFLLIKAYIRYE